MSNFTIVGEIGDILVDLLKNGFDACGEFSQPITEIALGTPDVQESAISAAKPQIIVFLFHIDKSAHFENPDDRNSKLVLELHYLIIASAKEKSIEHKIAGKAAEIFHENKVLACAAYPDRPGFASAGQDTKINLVSMSIDEKHKLWTAFPKTADKTFIPYIVRPVTIVCKPPASGVRVESREYVVKEK